MGLFAVLKPKDGQICVDRLDINVACLPALLGRRNFICDVGVAFTPMDKPIDALEICLPFQFRDADIEDLGPKLLDAETASLVFGAQCDVRPIERTPPVEPPSSNSRWRQIVGRRSVSTDADPAAAVAPKARQLVFEDRDPRGETARLEYLLDYIDQRTTESTRSNGASFRLLTVGLANTAPVGKTTYVRLRVPVLRLGRAWTWERLLPFGIPTVSTLDMRVADAREAATGGVHTVADRMVTITQVHVLIATGPDYRWLRTSPQPTSVRVLETSQWLDYLGRRISLIGRGKLIVNLWSESDVEETRPIRVYASVKRETRLIRMLEMCRTALIGIAVLLFVFDDRYWDDGYLADVANAAVSVYNWLPGKWILPSTVLGVVGLVTILSRLWPAVRSGLYRADQWVYNIGRR